MLVSAPLTKAPPQVESSHWYTREGRCAYQQKTAKGGQRPTDLRDARKLGLVPSVTTVLSVMAKDALTTWKVKQGIWAALTLPRIAGESDDAFMDRILSDSKQQAKAAAEEGDRIHDACERAMKGQDYPKTYGPHVEAALCELRRLFPGVTDWIAEASFSHPLGYGGKVDIHSPSTGIVTDYKSKDGDLTDGKRLAYDQNIQLAAYQHGLYLPPAPCANIFLSRTHPGAVASHVWTPEKVASGWAQFDKALALWKAVKGLDTSFSLEQAA